ncbi:bifunctional oligoribonuclease/PAP phosphatase NrnA [bacterium]|nr:bifunctional oligoribonuclease/PAP phosphatase NrnA [bacterium]
MFKKIERLVKTSKSFVLTTHLNPDGDGLGSEVAMYTFLKMMKKKPRIINTSPVPKQYRFLNPKNEIETYDPVKHDPVIKKADVIMVLDISVSKRLDRMQQAVMASPAKRICIDHHLDNDGLGHLNCVDEKSPATAELIYNFIKHFKGKLNLKIAQALYTALITDTGNFRFNATRPATHLIAAELMKLGVKPNDIYAEVFEQGSSGVMKLLGRALAHIKPECDGGINWTYLKSTDFSETSAQRSDTEGFVDYTLKIEKSNLGILFYETQEGFTKVSLRSKGNVDVQSFAKQFGGGGHKNASGITLKTPFEPTMTDMVDKVKKYYSAKYAK